MEPTNFENVPQSGLEEPRGRLAAAKDAAKEKLGQFGRTLKRIEVRESIVDHPFAAIGIAAGVGAIIGLARPMPNHSRIGGLVMAGLSALGMRFIRQIAMEQLGVMAKDWLTGQRGQADAGDTAQFKPATTY